MRRFIACVVVSLLSLSAAACGGESADVTVPTPEELSAALMTVEDVGTEWGEFRLQESGLVTDENRENLPELLLCPEAGENAAVADDLDWEALAEVFAVGRSEAHPAVSFMELLLAGEPEEIEEIYERLVVAMRACEGVAWETESWEEGVMPVTTEAMDAPDAGDESYGARSQVAEGDYVWDARTVVARDGAVLVSLTYLDVHDADQDALIGQEDMDAIFTTAIDRLP
jgi:hypothetical protein